MNVIRACTTLVLFGMLVRADVPFSLTVLDTDLDFAHGVYAVGDIDGDSLNDIVAGGDTPRLSWRRWPDLTTFAIADSAAMGDEVHVGDMDNDGDLDVITSAAGITWYENPRIGGNPATDPWPVHAIGTHAPAGAHDHKVGDIDDNGMLDVVEREKERPWTFYLQDDTGFAIFTVDAANNTEGTALADLDGDGDLDITDGIAWFECPDSPASQTWVRHDLGPNHSETRVAVGDISGDGRPDILTGPAEFGGSVTLWYRAPDNPRTGVWEPETLVVLSDPNFHTMRLGDIDRDGAIDIVLGVTGYTGNAGWPADWARHLTVYYNVNGDGSAWEEQTWYADRGFWQGVLGDVGSDGDLDLLSADYRDGGQGEFWENTLPPLKVVSPAQSSAVPSDERMGVYLLDGRTALPGSRVRGITVVAGQAGAWLRVSVSPSPRR